MAYYDFGGYGGFPRYVSVAERRAKALKQARKLEKRGHKLEPVILTGQRIASSFWGKEWGKNLESYMDFSNRLPRGRTYLRSGAVVDLRIGAGQIDALVAGSLLYEVSVRIGKLARRRWGAVIKRCAGRIDSVVGLIQGRLPEAVLEALVDRRAGGNFRYRAGPRATPPVVTPGRNGGTPWSRHFFLFPTRRDRRLYADAVPDAISLPLERGPSRGRGPGDTGSFRHLVLEEHA